MRKIFQDFDKENLNLKFPTGILEIASYIEKIENSPSFYNERYFNNRLELIDFIEFEILDQLENLPNSHHQEIWLKHRAEKIKAKLEETNDRLFQKLRKIVSKKGFKRTNFRNLIDKYVPSELYLNDEYEEIGYDNLDILVNELLSFENMPDTTKDLEPEMVFFQKTPARIVFELVEKANFSQNDVFVDIGSGLGQVSILVNLLSNIPSIGVEFEPAFCQYAQGCVDKLNLSNVNFINVDARNADFTKGTVFFLYSPFKGKILKEVLENLRIESEKRKIRIFTYGPCTPQIAMQEWLNFAGKGKTNIYQLGVGISR